MAGFEDAYESDDKDVSETASVSVDDEVRELVTDTFLIQERDTCFTHTLQLVIKDGMKEIGPIKQVLAKVAAIISSSKIPNSY